MFLNSMGFTSGFAYKKTPESAVLRFRGIPKKSMRHGVPVQAPYFLSANASSKTFPAAARYLSSFTFTCFFISGKCCFALISRWCTISHSETQRILKLVKKHQPLKSRQLPQKGKTMLEQYPDVMTVAELAEVLRCDKSTVYRMLQEGAIPSRRLGTAYRISKKAVIEFITKK